MSEAQFETLIQTSGGCFMRTCKTPVGGRCWVPKCSFLTTSLIPYLSCLIPFCAPNIHSFLTWALNLHKYDYLLFHLINAYDCYNQDFASWIMLTHYDFTNIVQVVREYRSSILSGPKRIWAFTVNYDLPIPSLHVDPTKGHNSMQDAIENGYNRLNYNSMPLLEVSCNC